MTITYNYKGPSTGTWTVKVNSTNFENQCEKVLEY